MSLRNWGATPSEIDGAVVGDDVCVDAQVAATRCITIPAPPADVFPWIRQMGFGRAGWYSYDWIDNLGRKSATAVNPDWQDVHSGSAVPGGPIDFVAVIVEEPRAFLLGFTPRGRLENRFCFSLAYELRDDPVGTRLVTRMRARTRCPGGFLVDRFLLAPGDGVMVRKQLLNLRNRFES